MVNVGNVLFEQMWKHKSFCVKHSNDHFHEWSFGMLSNHMANILIYCGKKLSKAQNSSKAIILKKAFLMLSSKFRGK